VPPAKNTWKVTVWLTRVAALSAAVFSVPAELAKRCPVSLYQLTPEPFVIAVMASAVNVALRFSISSKI
jgi:hypothetical protein